MSTVPDPEEDFEGFCEATIGKLMEEIEKIPESERTEYFASTAAARLYRLKKMNAPAYFIEHTKRVLQKRVAELPVYCVEYDELTPPDSGEEL